jgi:serine/threonine-protein kinase PpkA
MSMNIPGYTVLHEIARGGMGVVYLAIQKTLDRQVALKVLPAASARDPSFRKAFLDEGKVVARLAHPNIITLYDLGHTADGYYISMEYIPGKNLKDRIREGVAAQRQRARHRATRQGPWLCASARGRALRYQAHECAVPGG